MNPKTIFFDIDGTLLGTYGGRKFQIPESTLTALRLLKRNGHRIAVCSGRQPIFIEKYFPGLFRSFIAMNGTLVVFEGETVFDRTFSVDEVRRYSAHFDRYGCRYVFVGKEKGWARNIREWGQAGIERMYGLSDFIVEDWKPEDVRANVMDFIFPTRGEFERCAPAFESGMRLNFHPGGQTADLSLEDSDKAKGIARFLACAGIRKEDTVAFGDGSNDVTMMGAVGTGVAMGNAVDEVKRAAGYVTADIFDDGICKGLRHLGLI